MNGTPKVIKQELCDRTDIRPKDWFMDTGMMVKAQGLNARTGKEVEFLSRERGRSNSRFIIILEFLKSLSKFSWG